MFSTPSKLENVRVTFVLLHLAPVYGASLKGNIAVGARFETWSGGWSNGPGQAPGVLCYAPVEAGVWSGMDRAIG